jgi:hypothetical protein
MFKRANSHSAAALSLPDRALSMQVFGCSAFHLQAEEIGFATVD